MCFDRELPPGLVVPTARRLEEGGADQLWIIEDCFFTAGPSLAAAALASTERLVVGVGILPAVARTAAVTAMELATLCGLGPGRLLPGIGHGVQSWMGQMGVRPRSPLTCLEEVLDAVRRLLAGETVSADGQYVHLDGVRLEHPPAEPPPLLAGVRGPRSLALAGRAADGLVLAEPASPTFVRAALEAAGRTASDPDPFHVAVFAPLCVRRDRAEAHRAMAPWLARLLEAATPEVVALPFHAEMEAAYRRDGVDALARMPADHWTEIGPVGTLDDAAIHLDALEACGVGSVGLFPLGGSTVLDRADVGGVLELVRR
jgi:alkanesulfonate monooxygenase SsuD/methylene tetrahydromethanopterin reductase-like flavin-dependent oxidoreductase (luciferase family)